MDRLKPSRTAQGAAMHRAAHQLLDRPLVFDDPLALTIIGPASEKALRLACAPGRGHETGPGWHGLATPGLRAFIAARARFAEATLGETRVRQYLLLGAGLDTYAYRRGGALPRVAIFEVDHPATQAWKRSRLAEGGLAVPPNVVFVPVDFERHSLEERLCQAGFDFRSPAMVAWLGVTPYLAGETVMATLGFLARRLAAGSDVVFDYAEPHGDDPARPVHSQALAARVARAGEPFRSSFEPAILAHDLAKLGFPKTRDLDASALNALYFAGRNDGLRITGPAHCLRARV